MDKQTGKALQLLLWEAQRLRKLAFRLQSVDKVKAEELLEDRKHLLSAVGHCLVVDLRIRRGRVGPIQ